MSRDLRVGVIGCGWVGANRHIPSYKRDDRAAVQAVYDRNIEKARRVANENEIPCAHDTLDGFLDENLDIVSICTPPWTHADLASDVLRAGVNVLTEKPMAMNPPEAQKMVDVAEETSQTLGVVHNFLYATSMRKARQKIASGAAGDVKSVVGFQTSSPRRHLPSWYPDLPGQLFYDESPHLLYLLQEFLGDFDVDGVTLQQIPEKKQEVQTVNANFRSMTGQTGTITMVFDAPLSEWHVVIICERKVFVVDIFRDICLEFEEEEAHDAKDVVGTSLSAMAQETLGMATSGVRMATDNLLFGMGELTSRYIDSIMTKTEPPVTGSEGAEVVETMHDILEAGGIDPSDAPRGKKER
jgi:predicted dehydrogenase